MGTKIFALFSCLILPMVLPQDHSDCPEGQNQCSPNVQNHIQGVVDETIEERVVNVDAVVSASTKIMNEAMFPAMERQMERLFVAKMGELKLQLKAEMEQEMRAEIEAKVRQELAVTKQQMKDEIDVKIGEVTMKSKIELEQHVEDKIEEKEEELKNELESEIKEVISNEVVEQKAIIKEELTTEAADEKVIFAAVRSVSGNVEGNTVITYDTLTANLGEAMDKSTGTFRAPRSGLYAFTFSAVSHDTKKGMTSIEVLKNGDEEFYIDDEPGNPTDFRERNVAFSWMFELSENDTVKLRVDDGAGLHADECCDRVYFTGQLLHAT